MPVSNTKEYVFSVGDAKFTFFTDKGMIVEGMTSSGSVHTHEFHEIFLYSQGKCVYPHRKQCFHF